MEKKDQEGGPSKGVHFFRSCTESHAPPRPEHPGRLAQDCRTSQVPWEPKGARGSRCTTSSCFPSIASLQDLHLQPYPQAWWHSTPPGTPGPPSKHVETEVGQEPQGQIAPPTPTRQLHGRCSSQRPNGFGPCMGLPLVKCQTCDVWGTWHKEKKSGTSQGRVYNSMMLVSKGGACGAIVCCSGSCIPAGHSSKDFQPLSQANLYCTYSGSNKQVVV